MLSTFASASYVVFVGVGHQLGAAAGTPWFGMGSLIMMMRLLMMMLAVLLLMMASSWQMLRKHINYMAAVGRGAGPHAVSL